MKKFLLFLALFIVLPASASQTLQVQAMHDFSTANPSKQMTVKLLENVYNVNNELIIESGSQMVGTVFDVRDPKRLKRDAGFSFIPEYYIDTQGQKIQIKRDYYGKYSKGFDKKGMAKSAALSAANQLIFSGFSYAAATVEGVVRNEEGHRLKSGAQALYEASPASYVEKGEDLEIKAGDTFLLKFKAEKE